MQSSTTAKNKSLNIDEHLISQLLQEQQEITAVEKFSQYHRFTQRPLQKRFYEDKIPLSKPKIGQQFAFEVDMDRCTGCKSCVAACHSLNGLEDRELWRTVGVSNGGTLKKPRQQHITTSCHHCVEPACLQGCPTKAYDKDPITGIVKHLDDQCIGCQYCVLKCPYEVPKYSQKLGIVRKCDMCSDRLKNNEAPACVQSCPTEAIKIKIVDKEQVRDNCRSSTLVPGAHESSYTMPTTTYKTKKVLPPNILPANFDLPKPQPAHFPLIGMLIMIQMSLGIYTVEFFLPISQSTSWHAIIGLICCFLGLMISIFHLGRPLYAWRAILGVTHSWMSREILMFGIFSIAVCVHTVTSWKSFIFDALTQLSYIIPAPLTIAMNNLPISITATAVIFTGTLGNICSIMLYADCDKEFWRAPITGIKFFGSVVILGLSTSLLITTIDIKDLQSLKGFYHMTGNHLMIALGLICGSKVIWEGSIFRLIRSHKKSLLQQSARLMYRKLLVITQMRFFCSIIGGVILPFMVYLQTRNGLFPSPQILVFTVFISFILTTIGEILERYLFFTAVVSHKMPGSF